MPVTADTDKLIIVERPEMQPGFCAATLHHEDPKGFVDTLNTPACIDPRIYISVSWVEETARKLGMEYTDAGDARRVKELEEQLREADKALSAFEVIEAGGYVKKPAVKKPAAKKPAAKKTTKKA